MIMKFSEIEYVRPDFKQFKKQFNDGVTKFIKANTFEEADKALLEIDQLQKDVFTMATIANIRHDINTADEFYEGECRFFNKSSAMLMPVMKRYTKGFLNTKFKKEFIEKYGEIVFTNNEADSKLQSLRIIFDMIKESNLTMSYSKLVATKKTTLNDKEYNFYGLLKLMENVDRNVRKEGFEAWAKMYSEASDELDSIYDKLIKVRCHEAKTLKFNSYTEMAYLARHRFDYNAEDVKKFRKQILDTVTPICDKLAKEQAKRLNVDKLKYYDEKLIFPEGNVDPVGGRDELIKVAQKMYRELSKESGEFFDFMVEHELFDLETKPNKHMGGYCTALPKYNAPFIFSNFNGTAADVQVLTHEAGHCFNAYLSMRANTLSDTITSTSEVNEIHSMSMELFTLPWTKDFYGDNVARAKYAHLYETLFTLPYLVCVDEFQHEVYANPTMSAMQRRKVWRDIEKKYMPWRDYDGNEFLEQGGFWMQKQHIFLYPFYYVDYALAQLGAFEFYGKDKVDHNIAWADYVKLCKAGGTLPYLQLLKLANLSNPFDEGSVSRAIAYILPEIEVAPQ